mmetsp:Transcript_12790/g.29777  ORF Transcript_12790/g.29777 Transcript_12790/m.29777 type:complete len:227 (+) Transcript_12790:770-1450(+)
MAQRVVEHHDTHAMAEIDGDVGVGLGDGDDGAAVRGEDGRRLIDVVGGQAAGDLDHLGDGRGERRLGAAQRAQPLEHTGTQSVLERHDTESRDVSCVRSGGERGASDDGAPVCERHADVGGLEDVMARPPQRVRHGVGCGDRVDGAVQLDASDTQIKTTAEVAPCEGETDVTNGHWRLDEPALSATSRTKRGVADMVVETLPRHAVVAPLQSPVRQGVVQRTAAMP